MTVDEELAYLAGIIDGEGCVSIAKNTRRGRNYYSLRINVSNNSIDLMQWLEDTFGDVVRTSYHRWYDRRDLYDWTASGNQAQVLLELVLPFLIIKKDQAKLALTLTIAPYGGSSRWSYTAEEEHYRGIAYELMKSLNGRLGNKGRYPREESKALKGGDA